MQNIIRTLKTLKGKRILVLTHHNADVDAVASAVGLAEGLKQIGTAADIGVAESIARPAQNIAKQYEIIKDPDCRNYDFVILVETSSPEQLSSVKNLRADMVIDHHPPGKLAKDLYFIDETAKSSSQIIYRILKKMGCKINRKIARIIAAGIVADTAHLRLADKAVFEVLAELTKNIKFSEVLELIETQKDLSETIATLKAAKRMELFKFNKIILALSNVSSHEAAAARALIKLGADIAVVIAKKENETRISSRGKQKILQHGIDLSKIFQEVGKFIEGSGGGHNLAGSANGKRKPLHQVKRFILNMFVKKLGRWKKLK